MVKYGRVHHMDIYQLGAPPISQEVTKNAATEYLGEVI